MVQRLNEESGYTLVEILVAITIVSIVLGVASTVFLFANRQLTKWSKSIDYYSTTQIVSSQIYKDMMIGQEITFTDSTLAITTGASEITYDWSDGSLDRNGTEFIETKGDSLYIIQQQSENDIIGWKVIHKTGDEEFTLDQLISIRNPVYWKTMGNSE